MNFGTSVLTITQESSWWKKMDVVFFYSIGSFKDILVRSFIQAWEGGGEGVGVVDYNSYVPVVA